MKIITTFLNLFIILFMGAMTSTAFAAECPLCEASISGNVAEVKRLLASGVDSNSTRRDNTALMLATTNGRSAIVKVLLAAGANLNTTDKDGVNPLIQVSGKYIIDSQRTIDGYKSTTSAFETKMKSLINAQLNKAKAGQINVMKMLLAAGADPNVSDNTGWTSLMYAVELGVADAVHLLVEHGADVDTITFNDRTALMYASSKGETEIAKALLAKANPDMANEYGWTALMYAAKAGSANVTRLLIKHGVDVNLANGDGWTALDIGESIGDRGVARILRKAGAE